MCGVENYHKFKSGISNTEEGGDGKIAPVNMCLFFYLHYKKKMQISTERAKEPDYFFPIILCLVHIRLL